MAHRSSWLATALAASAAALVVTACRNDSEHSSAAGPGTARSADGVSIAYEVHGQGPATLVLVHGWTCDRGYWRQQVGPFSTDHRVVALDLAGHGSSGKNRATWSIANFANDVVAVIRALDLQNVVLVGHSLGGPVALEAGLLLPDRVIGVIGVDAFFDEWSDPGLGKMVDQLRTNFATNTRALVRKGMFLPTSPPALADSISTAMASAPPEIALPAIDSLFAWSRARQDAAVSSLKAPVGLILAAGGRSRTSGFQRARGSKAGLGIDEVPDAGHFLMLEAPEEFNAQLRRMLSRIPRSESS